MFLLSLQKGEKTLSVEDLQKALDTLVREIRNYPRDVWESQLNDFLKLFSVFQKDYDLQVHVPRKQLFDKCAYVDFEGNPAIVCNLCRFYHGLQKGCSWEEEKKELLEAQK